MIISFSVENWMSFRDPASLTMVASRERQHVERVPVLEKYKTRVLPVAAIYGGNASGKTNFFKALSFVKSFVVRGTQPHGMIPVERFRLDSQKTDLPARFVIELLADETIYELSFSVTRNAVVEEKLVQVLSSSERTLYHRRHGKPNFHRSLEKDEFLNFAFRGTRENQLFLTNAVSQKVHNFKSVYDWFKDCLDLVAPDSRFEPFEQFLDDGHRLHAAMTRVLPQLDTGVVSLGSEDVPLRSLPLPEEMIEHLQEEVVEGRAARFVWEPTGDRYIIVREGDELAAKKLVAYHQATDGNHVKFDMRHESDGSKRVIDLLPAFLNASEDGSRKVYVIDEVDRSLHTLLTRRLLEAYLAQCSEESRSQLLFTTHDVLLMDQTLLRRDEMWVTERKASGVSTLFSFSEYKDVRKDKDIRKSYLQGRLGGIPRLLLLEPLTENHTDQEVHHKA